MKWVALAILIVIVPFTYLTLHFRKPDPAFHPYDDMQKRANTARLLSAGFQRVPLVATRPALTAGTTHAATANSAPGGLPSSLTATLVESPKLSADIVSVSAAPTAATGAAYPIQFTCTLPDNKQQLAGAALFVRNGEIVITPEFEKLTGSLLSRTRETVGLLTVPAGALKPGRYQVTLVGAQSSRTWTLQVH